jgi:hypothetical protein
VDVTKDGETPAEERRVSLGLPNVRWEHEPFIEAGYPHLAVMFNDHDALSSVPDAGVVLLNPDFPMFETEIKYWQERFPKAAPEAVAALVREVYETEAVSKVTHLTQMKLQKFEKDGKPLSLGHTPEFRHMMEPPALTAAIVGLVNVEQQVTTRAGGRYGRASTKS